MTTKTRRNATSADPATAYARDVHAGKINAGPYVRAACARHLRDLDEGSARGLVWDLEAVEHVIGFFRDVLRLSEGKFDGVPFELHPSQAFIVGSVFGWKWSATGTRRFRRAYVEQGKGNGKSPLAAGIGLYGLVADGEAGAQVFAAASKLEQAMVMFNDATRMVHQSPALARALEPTGVNPVRNWAYMRKGAFFRPLGRDSGKTGSGARPHFALCDEVHEHPDRLTIDMLERGFKAREQPLLFMITNSGSDRNTVCWEEHEHAVAVVQGDREDDTTFSYVCALDEDDDPLSDPSCWIKANPLLGALLTEEYLAGVAKLARDMPGKRNGILRLHFCVWTDAETAWIAREKWEALEDPEMRIEDFVGRRAWIGLDLGAKKDITGAAFVFEDGEDDEGRPCFALFARGYTPADTLSQRDEDDRMNGAYLQWEEGGFLIATPGEKVRLDTIGSDMVDFAADHDLEALAYDRWLYNDFSAALDELGVDLPVVEHPQGWSRRRDSELWMPGSVDLFETLILERRLRIEANPALRSAVMSATFETSPAGLRRFTKQRAAKRIDLAVAAAMGIGAAAGEAEADGGITLSSNYRMCA